MQAQFVGPVMVNGQMMNLWSMGDFAKDAVNWGKQAAKDTGKFVSSAADVGKNIGGHINSAVPQIANAW